ncbi:hypothetical protein, partial [Treponema sp.]|uniref:hypothetical protein n=1 Tax=Treponema sp. TaxID=166 RepID=UPI0025E19499
MNFFVEKSGKKKLLILAAAGIFTLHFLSAEGISIEKVQNDPYFTSGSAFSPEDEEGNAVNQQVTDPDNPDTFYNAENWPGGLRDFDDDPASKTEDGSDKGENGESPAENGENAESPAENGEHVLLTDEETRANGAFNPMDAKFNFSVSYRLFYSP